MGSRNCLADHGVFPREISGAIVEGNSFFVSGVAVDTVCHGAPVPRSEDMALLRKFKAALNDMPLGKLPMPSLEPLQPFIDLACGALRPFFEAFVSRHPVYISGIPPLQAIFRAYTRNGEYSPADAVPVALGFVGTLVGMSSVVSTGFSEALAAQSGLPESLKFPAGVTGNRAFSSVFAPNDVAEINIGVGEGRSFGEAAFLGVSITELTDARTYKGDVVPLRDSLRFFETSEGYIGVGPDLIRLGDVVTVLKGSNCPAILRLQEEERYKHVGLCFVEGLVRGEAKGLILEGKCHVKRFEVM